MLEQLLTEQKNPASAAIDQMSTEAMLRVINDEDKKVAEAVERAIPRIAEAVGGIAAAPARGGGGALPPPPPFRGLDSRRTPLYSPPPTTSSSVFFFLKKKKTKKTLT